MVFYLRLSYQAIKFCFTISLCFTQAKWFFDDVILSFSLRGCWEFINERCMYLYNEVYVFSYLSCAMATYDVLFSSSTKRS